MMIISLKKNILIILWRKVCIFLCVSVSWWHLEEKSIFYRVSGPPLLCRVACHVLSENFRFCHNVFSQLLWFLTITMFRHNYNVLLQCFLPIAMFCRKHNVLSQCHSFFHNITLFCKNVFFSWKIPLCLFAVKIRDMTKSRTIIFPVQS